MKTLKEHERLTVGAITKPLRLDNYLLDILKNKSRSKIQAQVKAKKVYVNGKPSKSSYMVKKGDEIVWYEEFGKLTEIVPFKTDLNIVYETADLIVINKPAGMPMHPGLGNYNNTLLNALQHYYTQKGEEGNLVKDCLVQRIDKNTSGLVVLPKNKESHEVLDQQFRSKSTIREYQAIVWGELPKERDTLRNFMGRNPKNLKSIEVSENGSFGKEAVTHYLLLKKLKDISLIACQLETGRTHQIRVHLKHIGNPLVADERYYIKESIRNPQLTEIMKRHALHAKTLGFIEPKTGKELTFDSPLPDDFNALINACK